MKHPLGAFLGAIVFVLLQTFEVAVRQRAAGDSRAAADRARPLLLPEPQILGDAIELLLGHERADQSDGPRRQERDEEQEEGDG